MKEYVCVAPDSSLELWCLGTHPSIHGGEEPGWVFERAEGKFNGLFPQKLGPEFWGREIIGEL